ncbi:MAG: UTP--glucose-1-phosphate uridylyltransferase [candidate division KSB1 bacterium]|jgi:galactokinase/mevalonate kinase-like predicted kinase|nr:UTP--glucose-1-phosphate uridylyltransferase [candidate division KSB1 bacterium]
MSRLVEIITSSNPDIRHQALDAFCREASLEELLSECKALEKLRHESDNLYERVRALFFLYAVHRFHIPVKGVPLSGHIPYQGYVKILKRRFDEAIEILLARQKADGPSDTLSSALASAYHKLGFQTLADQVRKSVRSVRGNQWMFRTGHPADYPLRIHPGLVKRDSHGELYPILHESTPVRMDLSHSGWSDIFFLGMDFPEGARVLNVSIDLSVRESDNGSSPVPPVETFFRVIDQPILRLVSLDLEAVTETDSLAEVFDFAKDYLGLLKAAVIASGIIPPGMEGAQQSLEDLLARLVKPGHGIEIISRVNGIPKGSRLAVSTTLLSSLISLCMRATGQTHALTGQLSENERRLVAARAILGEWLGGSGGGWQDSGGVWPGVKLIQGEFAADGDPEYGVSRGRLLPSHQIFTQNEMSLGMRQRLQDSLVLVHGGMAQDVGPILEMVTEKYLLRSEKEWGARREAMAIFDELINRLKGNDISAIGDCTDRNFHGPIQTIIPWASNMFTETLIRRMRHEFGTQFYGFWMLGGMSGGGMGFLFDPQKRDEGRTLLRKVMKDEKQRLQHAVPFAIEPVVYDFAINEKGTCAELKQGETALLPSQYYMLTVPGLLRQELRNLPEMRRVELDQFGAACRNTPELTGVIPVLFDRLMPDKSLNDEPGKDLDELLKTYGFDAIHHETIRSDLRSGRIGLSQNRLPVSSRIEDVGRDDVFDVSDVHEGDYAKTGVQALEEGRVAVVSFAGGVGSRWTKGAGVVKALNPFSRLGGKHRNFIEVHLAKSRRANEKYGIQLPHIITTSYLTHDPIVSYLKRQNYYDYEGPLRFSPGTYVGLRLIPMARDLRFLWEEMPQQLLDDQAQKMLESLHSALIDWARSMGEGSDYRDNLPSQCLHPVGHWYEVPNLLRNGILRDLIEKQPDLKYLMMHNIDTLGADVDPSILGYHIESGAAMTAEVIARRVEDRGGGLARVDGAVRLIEGLALPREEIEFNLSYYNSNTFWIDIDALLRIMGITRNDLADPVKIAASVRDLSARMPTYITLKDVKKRWGKGQEDVYPVAQFEKLWGDMTALPECDCRFVVVPRFRGQQLKEVAQLDGWLRDGSAEYVDSICKWT